MGQSPQLNTVLGHFVKFTGAEGKMQDISWYINRLRAMSFGEVVHRGRFVFRRRSWRKRINIGEEPMPVSKDWSRFSKPDVSVAYDPHDPETQFLLREAQAYLRHEWFFFGLDGLREESIDWHRDPESEQKAPVTFSLDINHRDERLVGNIKNTWEKSRHHHLSVLALAFHLTRDEHYAAEVVGQIEDWIKKNPYLQGVHWTHPLEHAIRLFSWIWCWRLLRGSPCFGRLFHKQSRFWTSVYQHQLFISQTYSRGSSANNHLIGEMAGLFSACMAWPLFPETDRWRKLAKGVLEREISNQTYASGINRELAFSYHIFSLEFLLLALWEAEHAGISFSKSYRDILRRMIEVLPKLTDVGGNLPTYGDGDDGMALQLRPLDSRRDSWILEAGISLLGADVPVSKPSALAARVLGCTTPKREGVSLSVESPGFDDAGLFLLATGRGTTEEIFILAHAGPLGFLSLAAHGHADALSFTMSVSGKPILVDPGTYCYHTQWHWRQYFRGTSAHNTISVDNHDQSVQAGPFLWKRKAESTVHTWQTFPDGGLLEASHDGYQKLGVLHRRRITLHDRTVQVLDHLERNGVHDIALFWHAAPECKVTVQGHQAILANGRLFVTIQLPLELKPTLVCGGDPLGWHSHRFGVRVETSTVVCRARLKMPCVLETNISIPKLREIQ